MIHRDGPFHHGSIRRACVSIIRARAVKNPEAIGVCVAAPRGHSTGRRRIDDGLLDVDGQKEG